MAHRFITAKRMGSGGSRLKQATTLISQRFQQRRPTGSKTQTRINADEIGSRTAARWWCWAFNKRNRVINILIPLAANLHKPRLHIDLKIPLDERIAPHDRVFHPGGPERRIATAPSRVEDVVLNQTVRDPVYLNRVLSGAEDVVVHDLAIPYSIEKQPVTHKPVEPVVAPTDNHIVRRNNPSAISSRVRIL